MKCEACGAEVIPASKHWIDRETWEITDKDHAFFLDPEPHPDGRFSIIGVPENGPVQALYVPFNENHNLEDPTTYMTHASTCTAIPENVPENQIGHGEYMKVGDDTNG